MRSFAVLVYLLASGGNAFAENERATRVHVDKSERLMKVYSGERMIASYRIGQGSSPQGHKRQEGDRRTPEGRYALDFKKRNSSYFRAIHISFPNAADRSYAKKHGVSPGGDIMIHGEANDPSVRKAIRLSPYRDWTYGCIALSNADMQRLWNLVSVPTPIEIVP